MRRPLGHENLNGGPGLRGGNAAMELCSLLSRVITGFQNSRAHVTALNCQRHGECNCHTGGKGAEGDLTLRLCGMADLMMIMSLEGD